jgi:hypothetical protein
VSRMIGPTVDGLGFGIPLKAHGRHDVAVNSDGAG